MLERVIPGCAFFTRRPGIHFSFVYGFVSRGGFRVRAKMRAPNDEGSKHFVMGIQIPALQTSFMFDPSCS
jgi:hypothetical protein